MALSIQSLSVLTLKGAKSRQFSGVNDSRAEIAQVGAVIHLDSGDYFLKTRRFLWPT